MTKDFNLTELTEIIAAIWLSTIPKKVKYYHLHTIKNFIFHFHKLKDRRSRAFVYYQLSTYLIAVREENELDKYVSINLYNKYLATVGHIYIRYADFTNYSGS